MTWIAVLGLIGSIGLLPQLASADARRAADTPAPAPAQSYSIDQTRYFVTPEAELAERKQRLDEAAAFPAVPPVDPAALADYLHRAEALLAQLERHNAYLYLLASRNIDDQTDAGAASRVDNATDQLIATVGSPCALSAPARASSM